MASDKQERLRETLEKLSAEPGVAGALLVSRDGFCILNACPALPAPETFAAMTATLLGAAEASFGEAGGGPARKAIVEGESNRIVAVGVNEEYILVALTELALPADRAAARVEDAASQVASVLRR